MTAKNYMKLKSLNNFNQQQLEFIYIYIQMICIVLQVMGRAEGETCFIEI